MCPRRREGTSVRLDLGVAGTPAASRSLWQRVDLRADVSDQPVQEVSGHRMDVDQCERKGSSALRCTVPLQRRRNVLDLLAILLSHLLAIVEGRRLQPEHVDILLTFLIEFLARTFSGKSSCLSRTDQPMIVCDERGQSLTD